MAINIKLKHSSVANKQPLSTDLAEGELALNINAASPAAYIKDSAGAIVKLAGVGAVGATDATTTTKGVVQLADAAAITAGTAGRVVDAAQLKAATDADDWTRTGTTLSPKAAGDVVTVSAGTAAAPGLSIVGDPDTGLYGDGANQVAISTAGAARLFVGAAGNVGIGTTSPSVPLEVVGAIRSVNGAINARIHAGYSGAVGIGAESNHPVLFIQNGTERFRIGSSGSLLVGTSSDTGAHTLTLQGNSVGVFEPAVLAFRRNKTLVNNDIIGLLEFSDNANCVGANIQAVANGTWSQGNSHPSRLVFSTTADGAGSPTERMTIKSTGVINIASTTVYADNTAALAGGLVAGDIYRKADGTLMIAF